MYFRQTGQDSSEEVKTKDLKRSLEEKEKSIASGRDKRKGNIVLKIFYWCILQILPFFIFICMYKEHNTNLFVTYMFKSLVIGGSLLVFML